METRSQNSRAVLKALPCLIVAALPWPLTAAAEGASTADYQGVGARVRMEAFLNITSPFGLGPFNQTQIVAQQRSCRAPSPGRPRIAA